MTSTTTEGRAIRSNIVTGAVMALLVMIALIVLAVLDDGPAVAGPDGSGFVTTSLGTAALAELLDEVDAEVILSGEPLVGQRLEGVDTLLALNVAGSTYGPTELAAISAAVDDGMTMVMAGRPNSALLEAIVGEDIAWSAGTRVTGTSTIGRARVRASRFGVFEPGPGLPLVAAPDGHLVIAFGVGAGTVVLFSDVAILANSNLSSDDNAEYAVSVIGIGTVLFDEFRHGFVTGGESQGLLAAAPRNWVNAAVLLGVTALLGLVVYGRRLGPAEPVGRTFIPGREQLVRSIAVSLGRKNTAVGATEPVRRLAKDRIRQRSLLPRTATDAELRNAAEALLPRDEVAAIFEPTADSVITADRALARLGTIDGELR